MTAWGRAMLCATMLGAGPAMAQTAYVSTGLTLAAIDARTGKVTNTSDASPALLGTIAILPDGRRLEVASQEINRRDRVREYDAATLRLVAETEVGGRIQTVVTSPDGLTIYAISNHVISFIDAASHRVTRVLPEGVDAASAAVTPDGRLLFVAAGSGQDMLVVDLAAGAVLAHRHLGHSLGGIAVAPDGRHLYLADGDGNAMIVADTATQQVTEVIPVGRGPSAVAVSADGRIAYVACGGHDFGDTEAVRATESGVVTVVDLAAGRAVRAVAIDGDPAGIAAATDGDVFVADVRSGTMSILNSQSGAIERIVVVGRMIRSLALAEFVEP